MSHTHHQPTGETMEAEATTIDTELLQPPALGAYWPGQGGIYCGTQPAMHGLPERHLIFAAADAPERLTWGEYGTKVPGADNRLDGRANTAALLAHVAQGKSHPAAEWAAAYTADGHTDFHLPSQADLFMASLACPQQFTQENWYWSSTQNGRSNAFVQDFEDGSSDWTSKDYVYFVRPVRWIPTSAL